MNFFHSKLLLLLDSLRFDEFSGQKIEFKFPAQILLDLSNLTAFDWLTSSDQTKISKKL